jgi:hypothetical protein
MTIHYHGTPITPRRVLDTMAGRHFCVSFAAPGDAKHCHAIGQSVMLDNGAFSAWTRGVAVDWAEYYFWTERWLQYPTTWAVIPDVIDAGDTRHAKYEENDALIKAWPHGTRGAPVWHMHESIDRLMALAEEWPRVCIGSSKQYRTVGNARWHSRMGEAMNALYFDRAPTCQLHLLRGMQMAGSHYPFASLDSTDVARNHNRPQNNAAAMAAKWDAQQCPARWGRAAVQMELA